jgi:ubiquinone/menaquinone biosynthesis C-methylase UbiE
LNLKKELLDAKKMSEKDFRRVIADWQLPRGESLLRRVEKMIRPALLRGYFGVSYTRFVSGLQYHLGGELDTAELAVLANITSNDRVLDVCCFIGGPALQLANAFHCKVSGIDIAKNGILAANRIAQLAKLSHLLGFFVADAEKLPFEDEAFTVVWNQASLAHKASWLKEFDRVLAPGGRFAFTFQFRGKNSKEEDLFSSWTTQDVVALVEGLGYSVEHVEDLTERDIEMGWKALDRKLVNQKKELVELLGEEWINNAHNDFMNEIEKMKNGVWGNARIIAIKQE